MTAEPIHLLVPNNDTDTIPAIRFVGAPRAGGEGLNVEMKGPASLLPDGQKCAIHFEADSTVTIRLGTREYGQGYASPYLASALAARLGVLPNRVRLYYMGALPAAKVKPRRVHFVPSRSSVGLTVARIGDLIESLCDRVIEKGRHFLASSMNVRPSDIGFDTASGRFSVLGKEGHLDILDVAKQARGAIAGLPFRAAAQCLVSE